MTAERDMTLGRILAPAPKLGRPGLRAMLQHQEWLWRKSGLVAGFIVAAVIAVLTLSPMPGGARITGGIDKLYHFVAFAALIFPLIITDSRRWYWAVPITILYGGAIELIQPTVGRTAELLDFGADITGVLAGAALSEILHDRIKRAVFDAMPLDEGDGTIDDEALALDQMRAEMMAELRLALREELASIAPKGGEEPVGPSPAEAHVKEMLRVVGR